MGNQTHATHERTRTNTNKHTHAHAPLSNGNLRTEGGGEGWVLVLIQKKEQKIKKKRSCERFRELARFHPTEYMYYMYIRWDEITYTYIYIYKCVWVCVCVMYIVVGVRLMGSDMVEGGGATTTNTRNAYRGNIDWNWSRLDSKPAPSHHPPH